MFRIKIALIIGGLVLAFFGVQEFRVSVGSSTEPVAVELTELEGGEALNDNHILIGEHTADYVGCIYEYEEKTNKVNHVYYPIISDDNSFFSEINALAEKYDDYTSIPEEEYPEVHDFTVLVKSKRFGTINGIPDGLVPEDKVQGLVINLIDSLDSEERKLIQSGFPKVNLDEVYILEEGRKPTSMMIALAMIGGGLLLTLLGLGWMLLGFGGSGQTRQA